MAVFSRESLVELDIPIPSPGPVEKMGVPMERLGNHRLFRN